MKKFLTLFSLLLISFCVYTKTNNVKAESLDDSLIIDFDYYPSGTLSSVRTISFIFKTSHKIEDLKIKTYCNDPKNVTYYHDYITMFDMNWDLEKEDNDEISEYFVRYEVLNSPTDDPLTVVDESVNGIWEYIVSFKIEDNSLGIYKFIFEYSASSVNYNNTFYIPNNLYEHVFINPTSDSNYDPIDLPYKDGTKETEMIKTKNAIIIASIAVLGSIIGSVIIISLNDKKRDDDEE